MTAAPSILQTKQFEVGQIVCSSYGYNMTIVEFYLVDRMTKSNIWLRPIGRIVKNDDGKGDGTAEPSLDFKAADSLVFRKKIQVSPDGCQYISDTMKSFSIWDGRPKYHNTWD